MNELSVDEAFDRCHDGPPVHVEYTLVGATKPDGGAVTGTQDWTEVARAIS